MNKSRKWSYAKRLNKIYSKFIAKGLSLSYAITYKKLLKANNIPNKKCVGEEAYINKWKCLGNVSPLYYRLYSHYVGNDPNIVPEDILHNVILPILTPSKYRPFYSDKNLFDKLFLEENIMPQTILRCMSGFYYDKNYKSVSGDDFFHELNNLNQDRLVLKPTVETSGGKGVLILERNNGIYRVLNDSKADLSREWLEEQYEGNFLIQEYLEQSDYLAKFNPTSVNTIRVGIYRSVKTGECIILDMLLRVGCPGAYVDNAHSGGVAIGLNTNGTLKNRAITRTCQVLHEVNGWDLTEHYQIPNFSKIKNFAKYLGEQLPYLRLFTLDIMLDKENNPHLIEFNCTSYSEDIFQPNATLFGEYTDEIIKYVIKNIDKSDRVTVS